MLSAAIHLSVGLFWGAVAIAVLWKDGRLAALRAGLLAAILMAAVSAGCDSIRSSEDADCRSSGPGIYNDC